MHSRRDYFIALVGVVLVFTCYVFFIYKNTYNVPLWDEYDTTLGFLSSWQLSKTLAEKLNILFAQHNEHRMVFNHIIVLIYYKIFGQLNFRHLVFIGNLLLLVNLFLFIRICVDILNKTIPNIANSITKMTQLVLIVSSIILSPIQFAAELWAEAGIEFYGNILFSLLIIIFLIRYMQRRGNLNLLLFFVVTLVNTFICGSFAALFLATAIFILIHKQYKLLFMVVAYYALLSYVYFIALPYSFASPFAGTFVLKGKFFLNFLACGLNINIPIVSYLIGAIFIGVIILMRKQIMQHKIIFCWLLFLIFIDLIASYSRGGFGNNGLSSRYAVYSLCSYLFIIMLFIQNKPRYLMPLSVFTFAIFMLYFVVVPRTNFFVTRYQQIIHGVFSENIDSAIKTYILAKQLNIYSNQELENNIRVIQESK